MQGGAPLTGPPGQEAIGSLACNAYHSPRAPCIRSNEGLPGAREGVTPSGHRPQRLRAVAALAAAVACAGAAQQLTTAVSRAAPRSATAIRADPTGRKIQHVVVIMQENRSFDSYFGTYPGARGIPAGVCVPDPATGGCDAPYHDTSIVNTGGPHSAANGLNDIDGGRMDGFVTEAENANAPKLDVTGYHTAAELPYYWALASQFALQDRMFPSVDSWSRPAHNYMVSGWSAYCSTPVQPSTCAANVADPPHLASNNPENGWTDLTYLLHKAGVSWRYYVGQGTQPDCDDGAATCCPLPQTTSTPDYWNPLPDYVTVHQDGET